MQFLAGAASSLLPKVIKAMSGRKRKYAGSSSQASKRSRRNKFFVVAARPGMSATSASRALGVGAYRRAFTRPELKSIDQNFHLWADNVFNSNVGFFYWNGLAQGTGNYQRVGTKAFMRTLQLIWQVKWTDAAAVAGTVPTRCKVAIIYDKDPQNTLPLFQDVFRQVTPSGSAGADIDSFLNLDNSDRFRIIYHKMFQISGVTASGSPGTASLENRQATDPTTHTDRTFFKLNLPLEYKHDGTSGLIDQVKQGAMYVLFYNDNYTASQEYLRIDISMRMRYTDA